MAIPSLVPDLDHIVLKLQREGEVIDKITGRTISGFTGQDFTITIPYIIGETEIIIAKPFPGDKKKVTRSLGMRRLKEFRVPSYVVEYLRCSRATREGDGVVVSRIVSSLYRRFSFPCDGQHVRNALQAEGTIYRFRPGIYR